MIKKIEKLKALGIFRDYKPVAGLQEFNRYNLIYGWNGSGKTTLSCLFSMLETGSSLAYPDVEYTIDGDERKTKQKEKYPRNISVFNEDFVRENSPSLEDPLTTTKHIFILGKEDKELAAEIDKNKVEKVRLEELLKKDDKKAGVTSLNTTKEALGKSKNALFTDIAKTIASSRGRAFRDYDRRDAIKVYEALSNKEELNPTELEKYQSVIEQKIQEKLEKINLQQPGEKNISDALHETLTGANKLLLQTVQQKAIVRLTKNPDIAGWVAEGVELHQNHKSSECEYCSQTIPPARAKQLAEHFNDAHKALIDSINKELDSLQNIYARINSVDSLDKTNFYEHLRADYTSRKLALDKSKNIALEQITKLGELLKDKKVKTHESIAKFSDFKLDDLITNVDLINQSIEAHNKISDDFETTTKDAKEKLEKHYVSTILDAVKKLEKELEDVDQQIDESEDKIASLAKTVNANEAKIRSSRIACDKLNKMLEDFLGRSEICFEDSDNGYLIKRDGEPADHLSRGEKTVIAFVYFIICLESDTFDIKEGIIVVDDPISSLDMDSVYRVCALIKIKMKSAHQLILLTHNYEFLNQVKNWFNNDPDVAAKDKDPLKVKGHYYMIKNPFNTVINKRVAELSELDLLLRDYESEYHYLFKKLAGYKDDIIKTGRDTIEAVYPYPNIARKTLECFLSFRVPETGSLYVRIKKLRSLNTTEITEEEIEDVYNFINSHSHLNAATGLTQFDPTLAKNGETYIQLTLDLIKKSDPKHYESMIKLVEENGS